MARLVRLQVIPQLTEEDKNAIIAELTNSDEQGSHLRLTHVSNTSAFFSTTVPYRGFTAHVRVEIPFSSLVHHRQNPKIISIHFPIDHLIGSETSFFYSR